MKSMITRHAQGIGTRLLVGGKSRDHKKCETEYEANCQSTRTNIILLIKKFAIQMKNCTKRTSISILT